MLGSPNGIHLKNDKSDEINTNVSPLAVEISDAISEKENVKFTIVVKTSLPSFTESKGSEYKVIRSHHDFAWLHASLQENPRYAGLLIPPKPSKPDFESSSIKFQKMKEDEERIGKEEVEVLKAELEAEYLALFKKAVAIHEIFIARVCHHELLRNDHDLRIFLTYDGDLNVRGKNAKERLSGWLTKGQQAFDTIISDKVIDPDDFFEEKKNWLNEYHTRVLNGRKRANAVGDAHKSIATDMSQLISIFNRGVTIETSSTDSRREGLDKVVGLLGANLQKVRKWEGRMGTDTELKLADILRYYVAESDAAKDLLYRRQKSMEHLDRKNRDLDAARVKNKDIIACETRQRVAAETFDKLSLLGKDELKQFSSRRVSAFSKTLVELAEFQVKHSNQKITNLEQLVKQMEAIDGEL